MGLARSGTDRGPHLRAPLEQRAVRPKATGRAAPMPCAVLVVAQVVDRADGAGPKLGNVPSMGWRGAALAGRSDRRRRHRPRVVTTCW
jgi:hypothetical protein